jgi:phage terminase large subunit GpA-like protein
MPVKHTEEKAREIMAASDFEPLTPYPGSSKRWQSKCLRCGEIVQPSLNAVKSGKGNADIVLVLEFGKPPLSHYLKKRAQLQ